MDGLVLWFGYGSEICHSISVSSISVWDKQNDWISATHSYTVYSLQHVLFASLKKQLALTKHINVKQSHYRPGQALRFHEFEAPRFQHIRLMKVVRLSAICTGHFYLQKTFLVLISVRGWVNPRALVRPEGLCQWKKSSDTIGNRTRDLPACSAVPQPTTPPRAPNRFVALENVYDSGHINNVWENVSDRIHVSAKDSLG